MLWLLLAQNFLCVDHRILKDYTCINQQLKMALILQVRSFTQHGWVHCLEYHRLKRQLSVRLCSHADSLGENLLLSSFFCCHNSLPSFQLWDCVPISFLVVNGGLPSIPECHLNALIHSPLLLTVQQWNIKSLLCFESLASLSATSQRKLCF